MADRQAQSRYKKMQNYIALALLADLVLFVLYLIVAGNGIIWLKIILFLLILAISGGCLALLYMTQELTRRRSLWMTAAAGAILICTLFSLILNYPCPNPRDLQPKDDEVIVAEEEEPEEALEEETPEETTDEKPAETPDETPDET